MSEHIEASKQLVNQFHQLYYYTHQQTWANTHWLGVPAQKCPLDLWVYQEIIVETRPDLIIECGTYQGGSALFLASMCDLIGQGQVVTIDMVPRAHRPDHPRILYLNGSSIAEDIINHVAAMTRDLQSVLVILDSDHRKDHVLQEMKAYGQFVTTGNYLIVEDSNINGNPVLPEYGPGPMEAIVEFLEENQDFAIDLSKEKHHLTFNPRGYLQRISVS